MATATLGNLEKGLTISVKDGQVSGASQVALVTDIAATTMETWGAEVLSADNLPVYGSTVSISGYTLKVKDFDIGIVPGDMTKAYVTIKYNRDTFGGSPIDQATPTLRISAGIRQLQTSKDRDDNEVTVSDGTTTQPAIFSYENGTLIISWNRIITERFIKDYVKTYHNTLNSSAWAGEAAGTWRLLIEDTELINELDRQYRVFYSAEWHEEGWQPEVVFADEQGVPVLKDNLPATGYKTVNRYRTSEFNNLLPTREVSA